MDLPVFVDYLGFFEEGIGGVNSPPDVMRELHQRGVQESRFLPGGELAIEDDQLVLRDSPQRVSKLKVPGVRLAWLQRVFLHTWCFWKVL